MQGRLSWFDLVDDMMTLIRAQLGPLERAILAMTCRHECKQRPPPPTDPLRRQRYWIMYVQRIFAADGLVDLCITLFRPLDAAVDGCPGCPHNPRRRYYEVLLPMILKRGKLAKWRSICQAPRVRAILGFYLDQVQRFLVQHAHTNGARAMEEVLDIRPMQVPTRLPRRRARHRKRRFNMRVVLVKYESVASRQ